jgi:hypothetical protein
LMIARPGTLYKESHKGVDRRRNLNPHSHS